MGQRLEDRTIKSLQAKDDRLEIRDDLVTGLILRITTSGIKTFAVRYRSRGGRAACYTLGRWPKLTLAKARERATQIILDVGKGLQPQAAKAAERKADTLADVARDFLADGKSVRRRTEWRAATRRQFEHIINRAIVPALGKRAVDGITTADVERLVELVSRRAPTQGNRVLAVLRLLFTWGTRKRRISHSPAWPQAPSPEIRRERVLSEVELRAAWVGMEAERGTVGVALQMMLVTLQRRTEVLRMRWEDISTERDGQWWTIPAEFAKNGKTHRVPLSTLAATLLKDPRVALAAAVARDLDDAKDCPWVFPSPHGAGDGHIANPQKAAERLWAAEHLSEDTEAQEAAKIEGVRLHDFRRTGASHLSADFPRTVVARLLNHMERDVTGLHYDRYSYDREKRIALETWSRKLQEIAGNAVAPGVVIPITRAAADG